MVTVFLELVVAAALTMITLTIGGMLAGRPERRRRYHGRHRRQWRRWLRVSAAARLARVAVLLDPTLTLA